MDKNTDQILRVYARLTALRSNFSNADQVSVETGQEYDALLDRAGESIDRDFGEFKIKGAHHLVNNHFHDGNGFRSRLDGAINYLTFLMPQEAKRKIGF